VALVIGVYIGNSIGAGPGRIGGYSAENSKTYLLCYLFF